MTIVKLSLFLLLFLPLPFLGVIPSLVQYGQSRLDFVYVFYFCYFQTGHTVYRYQPKGGWKCRLNLLLKIALKTDDDTGSGICCLYCLYSVAMFKSGDKYFLLLFALL